MGKKTCTQCGKELVVGSWSYNGEQGKKDKKEFCSEICIKKHTAEWIKKCQIPE